MLVLSTKWQPLSPFTVPYGVPFLSHVRQRDIAHSHAKHDALPLRVGQLLR